MSAMGLPRENLICLVSLMCVLSIIVLMVEMAAEGFFEFLKEHNVSEHEIASMQHEQFDEDTIVSIADSSLAEFIPLFGDRVAVRKFIQGKATKNKMATVRRRELFELLNKKLHDNGNDVCDTPKPQKKTTQRKKTRRIELGWIHEGIQVRKKLGSGTRKLDVKRELCKQALIDIGKELFFPGGTSKKGALENFDFDMLDFKETPMPDDASVDDCYEVIKMGILTCYMSTKSKRNSSDTESANEECDFNTDIDNNTHYRSEIEFRNQTFDDTDDLEETLPYDCTPINTSTPSRTDDQSFCTLPRVVSTISEVKSPLYGHLSANYMDTNATEGVYSTSTSFNESTTRGHLTPDDLSSSTPTTYSISSLTDYSLPDLIDTPQSTRAVTFETRNELMASTSAVPSGNFVLTSPQPQNMYPHQSLESFPTLDCLESAKASGNLPIPANSSTPLATYPPSSAPPPGEIDNLKNTTLRIHRTLILNEMIGYFKTPDLIYTELSYEFVNELGTDAKGVSREAYTLFWMEFFSVHAEGERARVPVLNSKWGPEEWKSVGAILLKGFVDHKIFPLQLSQSFFCAALYGESGVDPEMLFTSLLEYLSSHDEGILRLAINGELHDEDDVADFLDILNRLECKTVPKEDDVKPVLLMAAHRHLIQNQNYALECISQVIRETMVKYFPDSKSVKEMYTSTLPTARRILKLFACTPQNPEEQKALDYIHNYIRAQDPKNLRQLLRFMTGSDTLCVQQIEITFTKVDGLLKRPVAHTCGPVFEMPTTFCNYREFRYTMDNILNSESNWTFDIV